MAAISKPSTLVRSRSAEPQHHRVSSLAFSSLFSPRLTNYAYVRVIGFGRIEREQNIAAYHGF